MNATHNMRIEAARGLHVFPLAAGTKTPPPGFKWGEQATRDWGRIDRWGRIYQNCNYGIACKPSNLLVVDCDSGKGNVPDWVDDVYPAESGEDLFSLMTVKLDVRHPFDTYIVDTPSGGCHYYFRWPDGVEASQSPLAVGWIDIRSNAGRYGGYVVGPGSVVNGKPYKVRWQADIMDAPEWLVELCRAPQRPASAPRHGVYRQPGVPGSPMSAFGHATEGNRNAALHWAACAMIKDGHTVADVIGAAFDVNPGLSDREIVATVHSAHRTVTAK